MTRKKRATEVNESEGTFSKDPNRRNDQEPQVPKGFPEPSQLIREDPVALGKYGEVSGFLSSMNILSPYYADLLEAYAITYSMWKSATTVVISDGLTITDRWGVPKRNPMALEMHKLGERLLRMENEFGLTPSCKASIRVEPSPEDQDQDKELIR